MPLEEQSVLRARLEQWSAALLAAATLTTAYSAYESTRWGGQQSTRYAQASTARLQSAEAQNRGFSFVTIDAGLFTEFAVAASTGNRQLRVALERHFFRDEFKPAFDAWLKLEPLKDERVPDAPFAMPQYRLADLEESERLEARAERLFEEGRDANQTSDDYVLATIFFAAVLFFGGLSVKFRSRRLIVATLVFGTLMFAGGVVRLVTLPFL